MMNRTHSSAAGFTLLEIMIAIVILSGLTLLTAQSIQNALANRTKFSVQMKEDAVVRDVLRVIERDVALAFHHRDFYTTMLNEINQGDKKPQTDINGNPIPPPQQPPPGFGAVGGGASATAQKPIPKNLTAFIGDGESMHFTSLANVRTYLDSPESEQAEVGYSVRECKSRKPKPGRSDVTSSRCLVRRITPYLDEDVTKGGQEVVLIEHVKEFKIRYFGPDRDDWVPVWKTGRDGDSISKENFPLAVEVTLTVQDELDKKSKPVTMLLVAPIKFPNNPPKKTTPEGVPAGV